MLSVQLRTDHHAQRATTSTVRVFSVCVVQLTGGGGWRTRCRVPSLRQRHASTCTTCRRNADWWTSTKQQDTALSLHQMRSVHAQHRAHRCNLICNRVALAGCATTWSRFGSLGVTRGRQAKGLVIMIFRLSLADHQFGASPFVAQCPRPQPDKANSFPRLLGASWGLGSFVAHFL
jgi:hypothetical protein